MVEILKAEPPHVDGIVRVCSEGNRTTYADLYPADYIEQIIQQFYTRERIMDEVTHTGKEWSGYIVAVDKGKVVGACGGGMIDEEACELYVMYLDPSRKREGIGTKLLEAFVKQQKKECVAKKLWVSVQEGNDQGIPFYEAKGFAFSHSQKGYGSKEAEKYTSLRYWKFI
ncbi:GNAT family N-acetyltransferase [Halobacillus trueperi]|uniref:GNAT family N-acetyltransferase n=1 Tax=Halobacillus trueperi TaxID=156205 RepID=A0A3E0JDD5_9BACI|nr:GNAT family N-acetyltransferase [Halobacillus trueperi]